MFESRIKHGGISHTVLTYASFMRAEPKFTIEEAIDFFPKLLKKPSLVLRSCNTLVNYGLLRQVEDGWKITEKGRIHLNRVAKGVRDGAHKWQ